MRPLAAPGATFASPAAVADVDDAMAAIDEQVAAGYTLFCMNPSQHTHDIREAAGICRAWSSTVDAAALERSTERRR